MKIRSRLLILLLSITLIPLILSTAFYTVSTLRLSQKLADDTREQLLENALTLLNTLVDEYGQILKRDEAQILTALQLQAQEVEHRLAAPVPGPLPIFFSADFAQEETQPAGLMPSDKHFRPGPTGALQPIPVTYQQQVVFLAQGTTRQDVAADLLRLASMPEVYRLVHDIRPGLFLWQYTALESGVHTSFPGKGGYPVEYDPRQREWYRAAKESAKPISRIITDLSTRTLILTMSTPVSGPDGEFAGVTAIDVVYRWLFTDWKIPEQWQDVAEAMILNFRVEANSADKMLEVIYRNQQQDRRNDWQLPVEKQFLLVDDPQQRQAVIADLRAGKAGVRKVQFQGRDSLWAYGAREKEFPFPLVSLPYESVVQQAVRSETFAKDQVMVSLKISVLTLFLVMLVVAVLAILRSRALSLPILQLSDAAKELSGGDFDVRVGINTGDELQSLGEAFNAMSGSLQEREQLKKSLELAREIQQHLLPLTAPQLDGFEILGRSVYCDETGGDYYDYIELEERDSCRLGLAVGDVSGHGIGAALLMTTARGILRSQAGQCGIDLSPLLRNLNQHLYRDTQDDMFMTLFYVVLDSKTRSCHWFSAGHGPVFHYTQSNREVRELPCSGIPLGILAETEFEAMPPISMATGDVLLIGTDGTWETPSLTGELFGTDRLSQLLKSCSAESAAEIYSVIMAELASFRAEAAQTDDITMVVIKAI